MVSVSGINKVKVTENLTKVIEEMGGKGPNLPMEVPVLPVLPGLPVLKDGPEQVELLPSKKVDISVVEDEEESLTSGSGEEEESDDNLEFDGEEKCNKLESEVVVQDVTRSGELSSIFGKDANELKARLDTGGFEGLDLSSFLPLNNSMPLKKKKGRQKGKNIENKKQKLDPGNSSGFSTISEMELDGEGGSLGAVGGVVPTQVTGGSDHEDDQKVSQSNPSPNNG